MSSLPLIRLAHWEDASWITQFNQAMAQETEEKQLDPTILRRGVEALLSDPTLGFYLIAEQHEAVAGCLMITKEWSDWRNGLFWWIQSVYVRPEFRRQGLYRSLYRFVQQLAQEQGNVCGFRLYVERNNQIAQETYRQLGMEETLYKMFEQLNSSPSS